MSYHLSFWRAQNENWTQIKHKMYTLGVVGLFSMMIFAFYKYLFLLDPLPLFTISLLLKIVNQVRHPPTFSAEFTKSSVCFFCKFPWAFLYNCRLVEQMSDYLCFSCTLTFEFLPKRQDWVARWLEVLNIPL